MDLQYPTQWSCSFTDNGIVDTASDCIVTATTSYHTDIVTSSSSTTTVQYGDFIFTESIIIFLLAFIASLAFVAFLTKQKRK